MTAFAAIAWGWSVGEVAVAVVIVAAIVAVVYIALKQFGVAIPDWVVKIFWVIAVAVIAILAIRLLLSL